jgi:hypothetical protein
LQDFTLPSVGQASKNGGAIHILPKAQAHSPNFQKIISKNKKISKK